VKKILLIHNKYKNLGGEDVSVQNEIEFLRKNYILETLILTNEGNNLLIDLFILIFKNNPFFNLKLKRVIASFNPDIIYFHNTWYKISLGSFRIAKKSKIKTIIKLHNFRYSCTRHFSIVKHLENKNFCYACGLNKESSEFFNRYFNNSILKSIAVISFGKKYFKILKNDFYKILVLTEFHKNYLIKLGFDKNRITVFPNYMNVENHTNSLSKKSSNYFVYAGRVSQEKGVEELINSFNNLDINNYKLKIIGKGPEYEYLIKKYKSSKVLFLGEIPNTEVLKIIANSKCVISTTKLYEGQPTLLCEASSLGIPSVFPNTGGIKEFFPENYYLSFNQFDYKNLEEKLNFIINKAQEADIGNINKKYLFKYLNPNRLKNVFDNI